jgi:aminopeptidase N
MWVHGMLANNEWREGWLDEGVDDFLTTWYAEDALGVENVWDRAIQGMGQFEARALSQPLVLESAQFRDFQTYGAMTYSKPGIVVYMLREYLGEDAFRRGLRRFYEENKLRHVTHDDFFGAMEQASGQDLDFFWQQWFVRTDRLDYGIGDVDVEQQGSDFVTTVEVLRLEDAWMPVTIRVGEENLKLTSRDRRQVVTFRTRVRPTEVTVDPDFQRRGIGLAMTDFAVERMKEAGMTIAMVETGGDSGHEPARAAYAKAGFGLFPVARYFKKL